ncbi:MAG: hypothetical protein DRP45_11620 [Candidatus Zixiibacteriota bacterium]|nr:MAG: hypothetical protein DRP45_11620 [candidate division Zixibacteria bacterium]
MHETTAIISKVVGLAGRISNGLQITVLQSQHCALAKGGYNRGRVAHSIAFNGSNIVISVFDFYQMTICIILKRIQLRTVEGVSCCQMRAFRTELVENAAVLRRNSDIAISKGRLRR